MLTVMTITGAPTFMKSEKDIGWPAWPAAPAVTRFALAPT